MAIDTTNKKVLGYYSDWCDKQQLVASAFKHPDYDKFNVIWTLQQDSIEGEVAVKAKGTTYLPLPSGKAAQLEAGDDSGPIQEYYYRYLYRADFPELLADAVSSMTGMVFQDSGIASLPPKLEYLKEHATPNGDKLNTVMRAICQGQLTTGRAFWLWDVESATNQVKLVGYDSEFVTDWHEDIDGKLTAVVLNESGNLHVNGKWEYVHKYRLCAVDAFGNYYTVTTDNEEGFDFDFKTPPATATYPTIHGKKYDKGIPGIMFNSQDLNVQPSLPITLPITESALKSYLNSADHEQGLHLTAQPTFYGINVTTVKGGTLAIGSSVMLDVNNELAQPDIGFLEITGSGLDRLQTTMEMHKATGRRAIELIESGSESGVALNTRLSIKTASLQNVALTLQEGTRRLLIQAAVWLKAPFEDEDELKVTVNTDFRKDVLTPADVLALAGLVAQNLMSKEDFFYNLRRAKATQYEDLDTWLAAIEKEGLLSTVVIPDMEDDDDLDKDDEEDDKKDEKDVKDPKADEEK